jgi:hypothetical protein
MDWEVTKDVPALGGFQKLNASPIIRRKPGYFVRNYIVIVYLLSSSAFTGFLAQPNDLNTRVTVIFTVLLSVVAFKVPLHHSQYVNNLPQQLSKQIPSSTPLVSWGKRFTHTHLFDCPRRHGSNTSARRKNPFQNLDQFMFPTIRHLYHIELNA